MLVFPVSSDLAEVLGVLLGDGCAYWYEESGIYGVSFTAHESEVSYYRGFVKPVIEESFGVHGRLFLRGDNTVRYVVNSKRLVMALRAFGIPLGKRTDAKIPEVVINEGLAIPFIRGFYHAEGSIYRRYSKRYSRHARIYSNLLVIQIRTKLKTLMSQLTIELFELGIKTNRLVEKDGVFTLRITDQKEIRKFLELVEPRYKTIDGLARL